MTPILQWVPVAALADLIDSEPYAVEHDEHEISLCLIDGAVFAIGDICPHEHVHLSDGFIEEGKLFCPMHQACFDVRTGAVEAGPATENIASYEVKIAEGTVFVRSRET